MNFFDDSVFFGVAISILSYGFGILLNNKFKLAIFNPLLISIVATIVVLLVSGIDYKVYNSGKVQGGMDGRPSGAGKV